MAIVYDPPTAGPLPSPTAPRTIVSSGTVLYICTRFVPRAGQAQRLFEVVFLDGEFVHPYLASTREGNTFTIRRLGGWPQDVQLYAEPVATGGPVPKLQPLVRSPYGAWTLDQANGAPKVDRSGHARDGDAYYIGEPLRIQAPVPGRAAWASAGRNAQSRVNVMNQWIAASHFATTGLSFSFWFHWTGLAMNGFSEQWLLSWGANSSSWQPWLFVQGDANVLLGRVRYFNDGGASITTDLYHQIGKWQFCCVSVGTDGKLLIGLDGVYEEHTGVTMVPPPPEYLFSMCGSPYNDPYNRAVNGAMFDVVCWDHPSTQAEFEGQRAEARGLAA